MQVLLAMASATFTYKDGKVETLDNIENLSMHPPYWTVQSNGVRTFVAFDNVFKVTVEGEEELIKAAESQAKKAQSLASELGIEP